MKIDTTGMIPKNELEDLAYYYGTCRNAQIARWDAKNERFVHWRHKFGNVFLEAILHPDDDKVYDVFIPYAKLDGKPGNINRIDVGYEFLLHKKDKNYMGY